MEHLSLWSIHDSPQAPGISVAFSEENCVTSNEEELKKSVMVEWLKISLDITKKSGGIYTRKLKEVLQGK